MQSADQQLRSQTALALHLAGQSMGATGDLGIMLGALIALLLEAEVFTAAEIANRIENSLYGGTPPGGVNGTLATVLVGLQSEGKRGEADRPWTPSVIAGGKKEDGP